MNREKIKKFINIFGDKKVIKIIINKKIVENSVFEMPNLLIHKRGCILLFFILLAFKSNMVGAEFIAPPVSSR